MLRTASSPIKTKWLILFMYYVFCMPIISAYLVVERRIHGHVQTQELPTPDDKNYSIAQNHMIDVETLAVDVASGVTYFLKNMHDRMIISNITLRDQFVSGSELKFETIHGR